MAPGRSTQLDELERAIGRLEGKFDGLDRYTHEREHGINNVSQKIDALTVKFGADLAALEAKMDSRLRTLELGNSEMTTGRKIVLWVVQTVLTAVMAIAAILALKRGI